MLSQDLLRPAGRHLVRQTRSEATPHLTDSRPTFCLHFLCHQLRPPHQPTLATPPPRAWQRPVRHLCCLLPRHLQLHNRHHLAVAADLQTCSCRWPGLCFHLNRDPHSSSAVSCLWLLLSVWGQCSLLPLGSFVPGTFCHRITWDES